MGWNIASLLCSSGEDASTSTSSPPAAKTRALLYQATKAQELPAALPSRDALSPPPGCPLTRRLLRSFRVEGGLRPSGGACSPWGPVSGFWFSFGLSSPPLYSDPEGRHVPCLGVCPFLPQEAWPPRPPGPPSSCPIQGAGPRRRGGWSLSVVVW